MEQFQHDAGRRHLVLVVRVPQLLRLDRQHPVEQQVEDQEEGQAPAHRLEVRRCPDVAARVGV